MAKEACTGTVPPGPKPAGQILIGLVCLQLVFTELMRQQVSTIFRAMYVFARHPDDIVALVQRNVKYAEDLCTGVIVYVMDVFSWK